MQFGVTTSINIAGLEEFPKIQLVSVSQSLFAINAYI
jgi:hypothetical protein